MKRLVSLAVIMSPLLIHASTCPRPPSNCQPGDLVTVKITSPEIGNGIFSPKVTLSPAKGNGGNIETALRIDSTEPTVLSFVIPKETPNGTYSIQVKQTPPGNGQPSPPAPVAIANISPPEIVVEHPKITAVSPPAAFRDNRNINKITVKGSGFRPDALTELRFTGRATPIRCAAGSGNVAESNCYELMVDDPSQITLLFHSLDPREGYFEGPQEFAVDVDGLNTAPADLTLINSGRSLPTTVAVVSLAVIAYIIYLLISSGRKALKPTMDRRTYLFNALFLDEQTSSYSLSKCQFYAWTAVAIVGYLHLAVSKSLVQGSATFPDIPSGLPIILLASAGTAVLATGITSAKGNKGAGAPNPNFSDFITTGGVVAADRLQFSLWTIVGIATFLMLVFLSDPSKIDNLPAIPNGFLELMGISAGAYIGGKLARKPGPTLQSVVISSGEPEKAESGKTGKHEPKLLTFELTGAGLSQSAEFNIDGKPIYPDTIQADDKSNLPKVIQVDPTINDPSFARMLRFTCTQPREEWLGKPHTFTIINPDKQKSSLEYEKFKIDNVELSGKKLTITGACLDANLTVEYPDAEGKTQRVDNAKLSGNTNYTADLNELSKGDSVAVTIKDAQGLQVVWNVLTVAAPMVGEPVQVGINPPVSEGISQRQPAHSVARRQPEQAGPPVQPAQEAAKEDVVAQGNGHK